MRTASWTAALHTQSGDWMQRLRAASLHTSLRAAQRLAGDRRVFITSYPAESDVRWGWGKPPNNAVERFFEPDAERFEAARETVGAHLDFLASIPEHTDPEHLHWLNGFWGGLDAGFQCAYLIDRSPARYVEVGSGYSTMFARHAIDSHGLPTTITSIDPSPRAEIDALCDDVIRLPLQRVAPEVFTALEAGDILLFDGSHESYVSADSVVFLLEILPLLRPGVLVGIDDVFLPWDYPADWRARFYAEQYLVACYLIGGCDGAKVILPAFHLTRGGARRHRFDDRVAHLGSYGKTLWLERA